MASSGGRVNKSETDTIMLSNVQYYLMIFAQFAIIFIIAAVPMPSVVKFILFSIFSSLFGIILSCIKSSFDNNVIETAIVGTMSIFGFMVMLGVALIMFGINLGNKIALFLLVALLLLIIARIVSLFMNTYSLMSRTFAMIGLVLFSLYIIYDTNHILQREYYGDFITASMDYYLDILNVFVNLLSGGN
jgi:FtsH-binding integral membrane protein